MARSAEMQAYDRLACCGCICGPVLSRLFLYLPLTGAKSSHDSFFSIAMSPSTRRGAHVLTWMVRFRQNRIVLFFESLTA